MFSNANNSLDVLFCTVPWPRPFLYVTLEHFVLHAELIFVSSAYLTCWKYQRVYLRQHHSNRRWIKSHTIVHETKKKWGCKKKKNHPRKCRGLSSLLPNQHRLSFYGTEPYDLNKCLMMTMTMTMTTIPVFFIITRKLKERERERSRRNSAVPETVYWLLSDGDFHDISGVGLFSKLRVLRKQIWRYWYSSVVLQFLKSLKGCFPNTEIRV